MERILSKQRSEINSRLFNIVCCPNCKGDLTLLDQIVTPSGRIKSGVFFCYTCSAVVGTVNDFKHDFLHFDKNCAQRRISHSDNGSPRVLEREVIKEAIRFDDSRLVFKGSWEDWDGQYKICQGASDDEVVFSGEFLDVSVRILKHPWSGLVRFFIDDEVVREVDLYQPKWSTITWFPIGNDLCPGRHTVRIASVGKSNPQSSGQQILFHELLVTRFSDSSIDTQPELQELNRTLAVPPEVLELMKEVPAEALILDYGSGDRILADPRYVSLEYLPFQLPMVYGDGQKLPFRDNVFDFLFSQAVLEHVPNPFTAVEEMRRVIKPGGLVWAGMAFMQPIHAVPYHYFNATAWGIEELFKDFEELDVNWFGELSHTVDWLFKAAEIPEQMDKEEYAELVERIKALDGFVSHDALRNVASGVAVKGRKSSGR